MVAPDLAEDFETMNDLAFLIFEDLLKSKNPEAEIHNYFELDPIDAFDNLMRLRISEIPEHKEVLHQFLTTEGTFKTLRNAGYKKDDFAEAFKEMSAANFDGDDGTDGYYEPTL